jgi:hypothetical protein
MRKRGSVLPLLMVWGAGGGGGGKGKFKIFFFFLKKF